MQFQSCGRPVCVRNPILWPACVVSTTGGLEWHNILCDSFYYNQDIVGENKIFWIILLPQPHPSCWCRLQVSQAQHISYIYESTVFNTSTNLGISSSINILHSWKNIHARHKCIGKYFIKKGTLVIILFFIFK